jgi:hypothetical protein
MRRKLYALAAIAALAFVGCTEVNQTVTGPTIDLNQPGPTPTPTPITIPSPGGGVSDVNALGIFPYGLDCTGGPRDPVGDEIPADCSGMSVTATPKTGRDENGDGKPDDARNHGNNITWASPLMSPSGNAEVTPHPANPLFNRYVKVTTPRRPGTVTLNSTLVAPDGRTFTAVKVITIR